MRCFSSLICIVIGGFLLALGFAAAALSVWRREKRNRSLLYFGIFCGLYGLRVIGNAGLVHLVVLVPRSFWFYQDAFITYLIPLPALLGIELVLGPGWKSSLWAMCRFSIVYAAVAILVDSFWGANTAHGPNAFFVIAGLTVITGN